MGKHTIAIIGGGPSAVTFLAQLLQKLREQGGVGNHQIIITVLEGGEEIGPGLPYSGKHDYYLLNLPIDAMHVVSPTDTGFRDWYDNSQYADGKSQFPPRYVFGEYLKTYAQSLLEEAKAMDVELIYRPGMTVSRMDPVGAKYQLGLIDGKVLEQHFDTVICCTGHMPPDNYDQFRGLQGYFHDPWQDKIYDTIPKGEPIHVIGTRLTAIDVVRRRLFEGGNYQRQAPVHLHSRNGLLPAVLPDKVPRYNLRHLTLENFLTLTNSGNEYLKLDDLLRLFWQEITDAMRQGNSSHPFCDFKTIHTSWKTISPIDWMREQVAAAEAGSPPWQQVLFSFYPIMPMVWSMLSLSDQKRFMSEYYSTLLVYLAAFPLENARFVLNKLEEGQLIVKGGLFDVAQRGRSFALNYRDPLGEVKIDYATWLINGTGRGYDPLKDPFYRHLIERGLASAHPLGGVAVNPLTLNMVDCNQQQVEGVFVAGEPVRGTSFATADMASVRAMAARIAVQVVRRVSSTGSAQKATPPLATSWFGGIGKSIWPRIQRFTSGQSSFFSAPFTAPPSPGYQAMRYSSQALSKVPKRAVPLVAATTIIGAGLFAWSRARSQSPPPPTSRSDHTLKR